MKAEWLPWATAILATLTALLDAGHVAHLFSAEVLVLVSGIVTAIVAFVTALQLPPTSEEQQAQQATKLKK